ncbi:MAG: ComEC/Rec2 family competence protein, partial [Prolixibacteraceae bacterium]|nr:ComEC/Rec2 family competence protein [Prolixibacteraceae bacterium]
MSPQNNIFGKIPFLRYVVAFILGILIGGEIKFQPILLFSCIVLIACTFLLKIAQKKKTSFKLPVFNYLTPLLFISFGTIYSSYYQQTIFSKKIPEYGTYIGTILEKAPSTRNRFKYSLKIESVKDSTSIILLDEKIVAYISDSISNEILKPGNKIQFRTNLYQITNSNNPGEFNFQRYMFLKKVRYQSYLKYQPEILPTKS